MVFSSLEFLFFFLPATLAVYFVVPKRLRNLVLLLASLGFYTWGGGAFVLILLTSIVLDYAAGFIAARGAETNDAKLKRIGILISVVVNVGLLAYFKYANWIVDQLNSIGEALGIGEIAWTTIALPIGISFFTFQSMSYTIDVARGRSPHLTNIVDFSLYVALFPQLIAGPIVRFHELAAQLTGRSASVDAFAEGAIRFSHGLVKKVIFADAAGVVVEATFNLPTSQLNTPTAWLGVVAYTMQIYYDFSGYSDMAIGLGRMFGFTFPENFRRPYSALSITDFWRRWHITLSNWFRDYLYIPLGGSKYGARQTYRNLIIVFLLTGLWHGAAWTFVIWGAYHGALLIIERVTGQRAIDDDASYPLLRRAATLLAVMIGWVLFRATSLAQAGAFLGAMFSFEAGPVPAAVTSEMTSRIVLTMIIGAVVFFLPRNFVLGPILTKTAGLRPGLARAALMLVALPYAASVVATGSFSPFLYYQF